MEKRVIKLNNLYLEPKSLFESGQMHRWEKITDMSYVFQVADHVVYIEKLPDKTILIEDNFPKNSTLASEWLKDYLDLDTNYEQIIKTFDDDEILRKVDMLSLGLRILKQPLFECLISFIISANNNISRIRKSMDSLAFNYGDKLGNLYGKERYSFPTPEQLKKASISDLRSLCGLGYRDISVYQAAEKFHKCSFSFDNSCLLSDEDLLKNLKTFRGIGDKVAYCIMLFTYHRFSAFPIDTWITKVMQNRYGMVDATKKEMLSEAYRRFGENAGYAQQFLFFAERESLLD